MTTEERASHIDAIAALGDPLRRSFYEYVAGQSEPVSRERAAAAVGVSKHVAAFHLERLLRDGLLEASFRRLGGRNGPGAGRPSKLYRRSSRQFLLSLPPRDYELAARLLLEAMTTSPTLAGLAGVARTFGASLGQHVREDVGPRPSHRQIHHRVVQELVAYGFEPVESKDGSIRLRNCPFDRLSQQNPGLVCRMNMAMMEGFMAAIPNADLTPELDQQPNLCCVVFRPARRAEQAGVASTTTAA